MPVAERLLASCWWCITASGRLSRWWGAYVGPLPRSRPGLPCLLQAGTLDDHVLAPGRHEGHARPAADRGQDSHWHSILSCVPCLRMPCEAGRRHQGLSPHPQLPAPTQLAQLPQLPLLCTPYPPPTPSSPAPDPIDTPRARDVMTQRSAATIGEPASAATPPPRVWTCRPARPPPTPSTRTAPRPSAAAPPATRTTTKPPRPAPPVGTLLVLVSTYGGPRVPKGCGQWRLSSKA